VVTCYLIVEEFGVAWVDPCLSTYTKRGLYEGYLNIFKICQDVIYQATLVEGEINWEALPIGE